MVSIALISAYLFSNFFRIAQLKIHSEKLFLYILLIFNDENLLPIILLNYFKNSCFTLF
jgi:hypothetical protein